MDEIEPGLYLGNIFSFRSVRALQEAGITHILSVLSDPIDLPDGLHNLKHMHIKIDDHCDEDLFCHFSKTNEFIEEAMESLQVFQKNEDDLPPKKGGILVHCFMGASRSATVVAAYLMRKHSLPSAAAVERLRSIRPIVHPNAGFIQQLGIYWNAQCDIVANPADYLKWVEQRNASVKTAIMWLE